MSMYDEIVEDVISRLMNYYKIKTLLKKREEQLIVKQNQLYGVQGIKYDTIQGGGGLSQDERVVALMIPKDYIEDKVKELRAELRLLDYILESVEDEKEMVNDRFINCMTFAELEHKYNYSRKQIKRIIKKSLMNAIILIETCPHEPQ